MKIQIDQDSCLHTGQCAYLQPEVFGVDDDGVPVVLVEGEASAEQLVAARAAAEMCPSQSILVADQQASD